MMRGLLSSVLLIILIYGSKLTTVNSCSDNNGGCQQLCYPAGLFNNVCACRPGFTLVSDHKTCKKEMAPGERTCFIENGGCEYNCTDGACTCPKGFKVVDNTSCQDIDECEDRNGGCEHGCQNTPGSSFCYCKLQFLKDGLFCRVPVWKANGTDTGKMLTGGSSGPSSSTTTPAAMPVVGAATVMASFCAVLVVAEYTKLTRKKAKLSVAGAQYMTAMARGDDDDWDRVVNYDENELRDLSILTGSFDDSYIEPTTRNNTFV